MIKKVLIGIVGLIGVLILAMIVLPYFIDLDSYKEKIIPPVEKALHRKVSLGHVRLTLFPGVGVELENLRISNAQGFSNESFVALAALQVRVKILPLLWGKKEVRRIIIKRPEFLVERNREGIFNFSDLAGGPVTPTAKEEKKSDNPLKGFLLSTLVIRDGKVIFRDARNQTPLAVSDVNLKVSNVSVDTAVKLSCSAKILPSGGSIGVSGKIGPVGEAMDVTKTPMNISLTMEGLDPFPILSFFKTYTGPTFKVFSALKVDGSLEKELSSEGSVELKDIQRACSGCPAETYPSMSLKEKITVSRATDSIKIDSLTLSLASLTLTLKGEVGQYSKEPRLNLALSSNEFLPYDLVSSYPPLQSKLPPALKVTGPGTMNFTLTGPADNLELKGDVHLDKADVAYGEYFHKSSGVPLSLGMYTIKEKNNLRINKLGLTLKDFVVDVTGRVENLSSPKVDLKATSSSLRPGEWNEILPSVAPYNLGGGLRVELSTHGKPANLSVAGKIIMEDVSAKVPGIEQGVKRLFSTIAFTPNSLSIENLSAQSGNSSLRIKASIRDFSAPNATIDLYSPMLNIDELLPSSKTAEEKTPPGEKKSGKNENALLSKTVAEGKIKVDSGIVKKAQFRNLVGTIHLKDGKLVISGLTMDIYGGKLGGTLSASLLDPETPFDLTLTTKNVDIEPLLKESASWNNVLNGSLSSDMSFSGNGKDSASVSRSLAGQGKFDLSNGRISGLPLMEKLTAQAGIPEVKGGKSAETSFNDLSGSATLSGGKVRTSDVKMQSKDFDANLSGSVSLDSSLDYKGVLSLSKQHSDRLGTGTLQNLVKDEHGRVLLPFRMEGTMSSPKITLDKEAVSNMLKDQARKKVEDELTKSINKELGKPETKKKLNDLQKEGVKKLKDLF